MARCVKGVAFGILPRLFETEKNMPKTLNPVYKEIATAIAQSLGGLLEGESPMTMKSIYDALTLPPDMSMGHVAFPCFPLARVLRKGPPMIAKELVAVMGPVPGASSVVAAGPYLNFTLDPEYLGRVVVEGCLSGAFYEGALLSSRQKIMIEYSQPNTHKEMHVGHMRNLCLGNALVKISRKSGAETISATYPGDVGTHVAKCLWYLKDCYEGEVPSANRGEWLGAMYSRANKALNELKGSPKEKEVAERLTQILKELHGKEGEFYELWKETRQWSLDLMRSVYDWAQVSFDRWFYESEVDEPSLRYIRKLHKEGKIEKNQGALGMDLKEDKLGFCLLEKSDGTGLYATKDVELARVKFDEFGIEKSVYVVDNRQTHHFQQVFKVLEKLGFPQAKDCFHLQYEMVELPEGPMSSRDGNIVPLMTLIEAMEKAVIKDHLEKYRGKWSDEEILETARDIANGAIKYGMLRVDNNRKIIFDLKEWVKLDGETGPYLQYVHARIRSLEEKCGPLDKAMVDYSLLHRKEELALMVHLNSYNKIVLTAAEQLKTIHVCSYLYDLAKLFNSFYNACPVKTAETDALRHSRLALCGAVGATMKEGLSLLGIKAPLRM